MSLVKGKDLVLYVKDNNFFTPIACSRTCVFTTNTEVSGKSTIGSGLYREYKAIVNSATLSADGIVSFDDNLPVSAVRMYQLNLQTLYFQFKVVDEGGEGVIYSGSMIITNVAETGNYNDIGTFSIQAVVTGQIDITNTVGNPEVIYFNVQDSFANPDDFTQFIIANPNEDILINYDHQNSALYYWMAHSVTAAQKTNWEDQNEIGNAGTIGGDTDLFAVRVIQINGFDYLLYITRYGTFFNGYQAIVKFYRIPTGCLPPDNFAITNITNNADDTGAINEVTNVNIAQATRYTNYQVLSAFGPFSDSLSFENITSSSFSLTSLNKIIKYNGSDPLSNVTLQWQIHGTRHSLITSFTLYLYKNGSPVPGVSLTINSNASPFDVPYAWITSTTISLNTNDTLQFFVQANSPGSDTNFALYVNTINVNVSLGSGVLNQEFQITGSPQAGGLFTVNVYNNVIQEIVTGVNTIAQMVQSIVDKINAANIPVPIGNQPPTVVSASVDSLNNSMFIVVDGTGNNVTASYLPASLATVTFNFDEPADPGNAYTIRIINVDLSTVVTNAGSIAPRSVTVQRGYTYQFAIRTECDNGSSDWTNDITQSIP